MGRRAVSCRDALARIVLVVPADALAVTVVLIPLGVAGAHLHTQTGGYSLVVSLAYTVSACPFLSLSTSRPRHTVAILALLHTRSIVILNVTIPAYALATGVENFVLTTALRACTPLVLLSAGRTRALYTVPYLTTVAGNLYRRALPDDRVPLSVWGTLQAYPINSVVSLPALACSVYMLLIDSVAADHTLPIHIVCAGRASTGASVPCLAIAAYTHASLLVLVPFLTVLAVDHDADSVRLVVSFPACASVVDVVSVLLAGGHAAVTYYHIPTCACTRLPIPDLIIWASCLTSPCLRVVI